MKTFGTIAAVLLLTALAANAAITADSLKLVINPATGQASVVNTGPDTIPLVGLFIRNVLGKATLIPDSGDYTPANHWTGIGSQIDHGVLPDVLSNSSPYTYWIRLANSTSYLGEGSMQHVSNLKPYASFGIGRITTSTDVSDFRAATISSTIGKFTWQMQMGTDATVTFDGAIVTPEPASLCVLAAGAFLPALSRRKRKN